MAMVKDTAMGMDMETCMDMDMEMDILLRKDQGIIIIHIQSTHIRNNLILDNTDIYNKTHTQFISLIRHKLPLPIITTMAANIVLVLDQDLCPTIPTHPLFHTVTIMLNFHIRDMRIVAEKMMPCQIFSPLRRHLIEFICHSWSLIAHRIRKLNILRI